MKTLEHRLAWLFGGRQSALTDPFIVATVDQLRIRNLRGAASLVAAAELN